MILRGILDRSLGTVVCIRGFAQIKDLERASRPNQNYQRELIPTHQKEILDYLQQSEYKFFPEIILSYTLDEKRDNAKLYNSRGEILDISGKKPGTKVTFSKKVTTYKGQEDSRNSEKVEIVTIDIDETIIVEHEIPFHRIDGNHRLSASNGLKSIDDKALATPFCLILLSGDIADEKFESVIFHNINSKGEHLTSEENLKALLNEKHFTDDEISRNFSWSYVKARQLVAKLDFDYLQGVRNSFTNPKNTATLHPRTVAINAIEFLKNKRLITKGVGILALLKAIGKVNSTYEAEGHLTASLEEGLFIAFLYYAEKDKDGNSLMEAFKNWVISNNIYQIKNIDADSVIKIFDKVLESEIRIFMAMKYYNDAEVDDYDAVLKRVVANIKIKNGHLNLSCYPIMREQGPSMDIVHNLLNNIRNCEIFIADISENNQNVFFEYGYAHSLNKKTILVKKKSDDTKVPFDVEHNLRLPYEGIKGLEDLLTERISQTIVQLGYLLND